MNREEAIQTSKNGAIAACVAGALTTLLVSIALFTDAQGSFARSNDPLGFIDATHQMIRDSRPW